jgi:hypothetical protein
MNLLGADEEAELCLVSMCHAALTHSENTTWAEVRLSLYT